jgi:hypothetical protein
VYPSMQKGYPVAAARRSTQGKASTGLSFICCCAVAIKLFVVDCCILCLHTRHTLPTPTITAYYAWPSTLPLPPTTTSPTRPAQRTPTRSPRHATMRQPPGHDLHRHPPTTMRAQWALLTSGWPMRGNKMTFIYLKIASLNCPGAIMWSHKHHKCIWAGLWPTHTFAPGSIPWWGEKVFLLLEVSLSHEKVISIRTLFSPGASRTDRHHKKLRLCCGTLVSAPCHQEPTFLNTKGSLRGSSPGRSTFCYQFESPRHPSLNCF